MPAVTVPAAQERALAVTRKPFQGLGGMALGPKWAKNPLVESEAVMHFLRASGSKSVDTEGKVSPEIALVIEASDASTRDCCNRD